MADSGDQMAYVGIKSCGCVVAATVDNPAHQKEVAKDVATFIKEGLTIERKTCAWVRENFEGCKCQEKDSQ